MIIGDVNEEKVLKAVRQIENQTGRETNYILWSEKEFNNRIKSKHHLLTDIIGKPFIMLIGEEDEFRGALLRDRTIRRIRPDHKLALNSVKRAHRDIDTAKTLIANEKFDWSLAVSYNAMLVAGRALMFDKGYRPSSTEGHTAVIKFLRTFLGTEASDRMIAVMDNMRKKRHRVVYEEMDIVSKDEAKQGVKVGRRICKKDRRDNPNTKQKTRQRGTLRINSHPFSSPLYLQLH